jgi:hypothetical protein
MTDHAVIRPETDARLAELVDKQALRELAFAYCRGVDRQDFALLRSLYHEDAIDDHGVFCGSAEAYVDWLAQVLPIFEVTCHSIANAWYRLDGDRAEGELYFQAYHRTPALDELIVAGRYVDRYARRAGVWKFAHRVVLIDWAETRKADPATYASQVAGVPHGLSSAADPSYAALSLFGRHG